jgi:hypothetical protein
VHPGGRRTLSIREAGEPGPRERRAPSCAATDATHSPGRARSPWMPQS